MLVKISLTCCSLNTRGQRCLLNSKESCYWLFPKVFIILISVIEHMLRNNVHCSVSFFPRNGTQWCPRRVEASLRGCRRTAETLLVLFSSQHSISGGEGDRQQSVDVICDFLSSVPTISMMRVDPVSANRGRFSAVYWTAFIWFIIFFGENLKTLFCFLHRW